MFSVNNNVFKRNYCVVPKENPDEKDTNAYNLEITVGRLTFKDFTDFVTELFILEIVRWSTSTAYHLLILKFHSQNICLCQSSYFYILENKSPYDTSHSTRAM